MARAPACVAVPLVAVFNDDGDENKIKSVVPIKHGEKYDKTDVKTGISDGMIVNSKRV